MTEAWQKTKSKERMTSHRDTILIVDDTPTNLGVLFDYLRNSGFKVLVAEDGKGAIQRASYAKPDIILLDVLMPGLDGFETCRRLKKNEATKDIPVIFMTALSDTVDKVRGFDLGAVDYVTKPLHHEEVLARIHTHLTIRNLQKSLQEQITERDRLIADLDAFAHTVAHDLKGPLSIITGYTSVLEDGWSTMLAEETQELLQIIVQTGHKMSHIIDGLLLLARVRREKVEIIPLNMARIIANAQKRLAYMIEEYQAEIIIPTAWPTARGVPLWVEEVWVNYLSNGLKYGGQPPRLELGATPQVDGMIRFWVSDNGPGLTSQAQAQLFTPFTRLDKTRAHGYGLGLSIVQRIVEKLGGQVGVESEGIPGHGSMFSFTLPAWQRPGE